ncbi:glycosyltransferase family 4 protein [Azonexus hydrophilus]
MKLLVLSQYFWPENFRINELVTALNAKGVEVEVLTGKPNYPAGTVFAGYRACGCTRELFQGVSLHRVPLMPRGRGGLRLALNYVSFILSGLVFAPWLLRGRHFDAIFVFAPSPVLQAIPAIWLGWLKKCPVLLWVQDLWPESLSATGHVTHPGALKAVEHVVRWIYRKVDLLLVQSRAFMHRVQVLAADTPVVYYPNSFLEDEPGVARPDVDCPGFDCGFPVLFSGNLGTAQAVDVVLEAATLLSDEPDIRFVMVGDGSRRDWMMQQAAARGLGNLVFPGRFPVEAMPVLMGRAAALLVTLADTEIFRLTIPSKVQAYMASGRPIVACLNGAGAEVVDEAGAGVTVPAEDGAALARAIRALHAQPEAARAAMGARGRRYYEEHFSHEKLVDELIARLDQCVHRYRGHEA